MKIIHNGRKRSIASMVTLPKPQKDNFKGYVYVVKFIREGDEVVRENFVYKVGFSCDVKQRVKQELTQYDMRAAIILWVSPVWQESTGRRIEKQTIDKIKKSDFIAEWIPKERFRLKKGHSLNLAIKSVKTYEIRD